MYSKFLSSAQVYYDDRSLPLTGQDLHHHHQQQQQQQQQHQQQQQYIDGTSSGNSSMLLGDMSSSYLYSSPMCCYPPTTPPPPPPLDHRHGFYDLLFAPHLLPKLHISSLVAPSTILPSPSGPDPSYQHHSTDYRVDSTAPPMVVTAFKKSSYPAAAAAAAYNSVGGGGGGRKRSAALRKDRHSKIVTAQGPRDRRMRLSLDVAKKFFDLQDMLGFDKASKTVEWLLNKSSKDIKAINMVNSSSGDNKAAAEEEEEEEESSSTSHCGCEDASSQSQKQVVEDDGNDDDEEEEEEEKYIVLDGDDGPLVPLLKSSSANVEANKAITRGVTVTAVPPWTSRDQASHVVVDIKESREKARTRARDRTREKRMRVEGSEELGIDSISQNQLVINEFGMLAVAADLKSSLVEEQYCRGDAQSIVGINNMVEAADAAGGNSSTYHCNDNFPVDLAHHDQDHYWGMYCSSGNVIEGPRIPDAHVQQKPWDGLISTYPNIL